MGKPVASLGSGRLGREWKTIRYMVDIYCRDHHQRGEAKRCRDCEQFLAYARARLAKCPYGEEKPTCANCPIHCYKREPRAFAKTMMRYSGPRMLTGHPWLAIRHLLEGRREVQHPMALRRQRRSSS